MKTLPDLSFETRCGPGVIGIDEVGRGPWAGPVVAAAVMLEGVLPEGVNDSKLLSARRRAALHDTIRAQALVGVGEATVEEIEQLNISQATALAMRRAVEALGVKPSFALIDGNRIPGGLPCPAEAIVRGDALCASIAAASVIAKVTRDRAMAALALEHPGYGWERNVGYGTAQHRAALLELGVTAHHRRTFKPIHKMLYEEQALTH
ncbi:ribonuclease HII [Paroceanicella profunda]|uniref:Ribonuclease HII n=1 Tax=Paroceanicella profunda TaxID=2579971 RepID=A0A5B8FXU1_9RHOB|nr:ribonuclease HII [Paroceanicella profunda]QDL90893.1 ribonuclease HII [Paroceanicella profunda]